MAKIVRTESRQRGPIGWFFRVVFWVFNLVMAAWTISYWAIISNQPSAGSTAEKAGTAIVATIGTGLIFALWVMGAIILGLLVVFTRGRKTIVEERFE